MDKGKGTFEAREFLFKGKPHPLLIPTIAHKILSYLSYSDLKRLRQVCTEWEYEASNLLQSKTQIRLATEDQIKKYLYQLSHNYSCNSFEFGADITLKIHIVQQFYSKYGPDIKSLTLHNAEWTGAQLWEILVDKLPKLEELSIHIFIPKYGHLCPDPNKATMLPNIKSLKLHFSIDKPDFYFSNPTILRELFLAVPNLEQIFCPNWPTIILPSTNVSSLVFNVMFSDPNIKFEKLSNLHINANLNNTEIHKLLNKQFPLKELRLDLMPGVRGLYLHCLLRSIEETLTTLILTFPCLHDSQNFEDFPLLRNLKYLCLHRFQGSLYCVIQNLPALKTLVLNDVTLREIYRNQNSDPQGQGVVEISKTSFLNLEELCIEGRNYSPIGQTRELVQLFPGLKKLRMQNVTDTVLTIIYVGLPCLEELIAEGTFTDSGVTGIPLEVCKEIYANKEYLIFTEENVSRIRTYLYVGNLTKLRRLELDSDFMTTLSVLLGVNDCKKLEKKRVSSFKVLHW